MANIVQLKRSSVAGRVPDAANIEVGEPVVNLADQIIYTKDGNGDIIIIGQGPSSSSYATVADLTTDNVVEISNLYFSNDRVYSNVIQLNYAKTANLTTANVVEVTNLYFTNARAIAALTAGTNITIDANGRINSTATGGGGGSGATVTISNTQPAVAAAGNFWLDQDDGIISVSIDGIWQEFARTLKGYAVPNYVDNQEYTSLKLAYGLEDLANVGIWNPANDDLLTYHNGAWISKPFSVVTGNIAESTNLYFTNARARAAVTGTSGLSYDSSTGVFGFDPLASVQFNNVTLSGNLIVQGTSTVVNTRNFTVSDNMLYLNEATSLAVVNAVGDGVNVVYTVSTTHDFEVGDATRITGITPSGYNSGWANIIAITSNTLTIANTYTGSYVSGGNVYVKAAINPDLGITGGYNDGTYHHTGVFRDASDGNWKFFHKYTPEPDADTFIDTSHTSFELANVQAQLFIGNVTGDVTGTVSSLSNHTTTNLNEGTNQYYSNTRVLNYLTDNNRLFPSGTKMLFVQSTAPTGWTKDTTHNDKTLRVVSGNVSYSGNVAFSTVFASRTPTGNVGSTTLTAAQSGMPAHSHGVSDPGHNHTQTTSSTDGATVRADASSGGTVYNNVNNINSNTTGISINNATAVDASSGHTHTWTGDALNFDINYVDVIIATKD